MKYLLAALSFLAQFLRALGGAAAHDAGKQEARAQDNATRFHEQAAKADEQAAIAVRRDEPADAARRMRDGSF